MADQGKASLEMLADLWHLLTSRLQDVLSRPKKASVEYLTVARRLLKDSGFYPQTDKDRETVERLYRAYLLKLSEAMQAERPSASLLAEARAFLSWVGAPDIPAAVAGQAAKQLHDLNVPFSTDTRRR